MVTLEPIRGDRGAVFPWRWVVVVLLILGAAGGVAIQLDEPRWLGLGLLLLVGAAVSSLWARFLRSVDSGDRVGLESRWQGLGGGAGGIGLTPAAVLLGVLLVSVGTFFGIASWLVTASKPASPAVAVSVDAVTAAPRDAAVATPVDAAVAASGDRADGGAP